MKKILSFLSIALFLTGLNSCQDPDPASVYGWTAQGQNIPGPRILQKVELGTQLMEEYSTANGMFTKMTQFVYDNTALSEKHEFSLTYNGNKVTAMNVNYTTVSNGQQSTDVFTPAYSGNRLVSYTRVTTDPFMVINHTGEFSYDTSGKITKLLEKSFHGNNALPSVEKHYNLTYSGNNIAKVEKITKNMDPTTGTVMNTFVENDEYTLYDTKLTPYSTLPKYYRMLLSAVVPNYFYTLSENNPGKYKMSNPLLPVPVEQVNSFQYDQQNYAITNGSLRYFYKAL